MTKKDYVLIAKAIKECHNSPLRELSEEGRKAIESVAVNLAFYLRQDNERFHHERFMSACGIPVKCYCDCELSIPHIH